MNTNTIPLLSTKQSWRLWHYNPNMDKRVMKIRAWIMFSMILLVYAMFQLAFNSVNQANSTGNGPVATLYPLSATDPTISRISTWSITLARGVTAVSLGFLVQKIGHKNGIIFALGLMILSLPFVFTPEMRSSLLAHGSSPSEASQISYGLFLLFRIFLAIGGTATLIYSAPVIAKFFVEPKQRNAAVKFSSAPAQLAGIIASLLFIDQVTRFNIAGNWTVIGGVIIGIVILSLIVYLIFGMEFKLSTRTHNSKQIEDKVTEDKLGYVLKQRRVWFLCLAGAFTLYAGIEPASGVLSNFWNRNPQNVGQVWDLATGQILGTSNIATYQFAWQILFSVGLYTGLATVGKWTSTKYSVAPYAGVVTIVGLGLWGVSYGLGSLGLEIPVIAAFTLIFGLLGATFIFGAQVTSGVIIYKWGFNTTQVTYYTSFNWTFLYIAYSVLDIITSFVGSAGVTANPATYADLIVNDPSLFNSALGSNIETFNSVRNNLIGWVPTTAINGATFTAQAWNVNPADFLVSVSASKITSQYVPQLIVIAVVPLLSAVFFLLILSRSKDEIAFSFKHFKENHMKFPRLKKWLHMS
ncbi:hypothetical protein [[Mycoplasma] testudinis]|uniref:hypothetical protein n=1 Tax=[Mycoplasma] testudinis TaxID=33924 RepID=UPI0012ECB7E5|nr:hypothetical protein [[Mycoplasma] testudinis]